MFCSTPRFHGYDQGGAYGSPADFWQSESSGYLSHVALEQAELDSSL